MVKLLNNIKGDKIIWTVVLLLSIVSILAVYSSTGSLSYRYHSGNTEYYLIKHLFIVLFGFGLMYATHLLSYKYYSGISIIAMVITVPLLLVTMRMGTSLNEASRWLTLPGINLSFQTSDFAKLALILFIARILAKKQDNIKDFKQAFIPIIVPIVIICGLILPANFSTAAILFVTNIVLIFVGRVSIKYILALIGTVIVLLTIFIAILINYSGHKVRLETWKHRIEVYAESMKQKPDSLVDDKIKNGDLKINDENYQVMQAKIAIATGGVLGKGPGNSVQRNFLPHPYSDFIYAIIIEEYGIIGGFVILALYMILMFRAIKIVTNSPGTFGAFLAFGLSFSLVFQALINMAVAVNLLPVTGQPLPFVSMGGTSIWFSSIALGIILSVSKNISQEGATNAEG
ncbi:MAG: FtsW/RodA/SpoVE family cell cycle protein [Bacteroidota bacterium]|nr:FtsW/RodA/SpoVE family cell cycle protein [Bacteroidota bacterium]